MPVLTSFLRKREYVHLSHHDGSRENEIPQIHKAMKRIFLVCLLTSVAAIARSQGIVAIKGDGTSPGQDVVLLDGESCTFSRNDGKPAEWTIEIETLGGMHTLKRAYRTLDIELEVTPTYKEWPDLHPVRHIVGDDVYWKCRVKSLDISGNECELPFRLLVLPSTPRIMGIEALYDGFDYAVPVFINARLDFEVESRRAKFVYVTCQYNSGSKWENDLEISGNKFDEESPVQNTGYREWDVWERYFLHTSNSYGISESSDTVYTNDLITDPNIRSALGLECSGIPAAKGKGLNIAVSGKEIILGSDVELTGLYSLQGIPVSFTKDGRTVRIKNTVKGFVVAKFRINNLTTTKIIEL